jgi:hypothetical protein
MKPDGQMRIAIEHEKPLELLIRTKLVPTAVGVPENSPVV